MQELQMDGTSRRSQGRRTGICGADMPFEIISEVKAASSGNDRDPITGLWRWKRLNSPQAGSPNSRNR
jgi:hypothetical protein